MILSEINTIYKRDGLKKAEDNSYSWFTKAKKNPYDPSVSFIERQMLQVGKINQFSYNPKNRATLDYFDKKPLVISLGTFRRNKQIYELGINLNFIPAPYKWYVLEAIQKLYSGFFNRFTEESRYSLSAIKQPQIQYRYQVLKSLLRKYGFEFAIRTYIPSRKSKVYCISYNNWVDTAFLSIENFEGISYNEMIRQFNFAKNRR